MVKNNLKIAIASDHAGFEYKESIIDWLKSIGKEVSDFGCYSSESADYPDFAVTASKAVSDGSEDIGILICGTGIGMSITANKVNGIRAADCLTEEMAKLSREHNNANVLTLGARLMDIETGKSIILTFLDTEFQSGRHSLRVAKIHDLTGR